MSEEQKEYVNNLLHTHRLGKINFSNHNDGETTFIIDLFVHHKITETIDNKFLVLLGHYYLIENEYDKMKQYYIKAIQMGNTNAMFSLGLYYQNHEHNYDLMKQYYLMAIELGNDIAMCQLGYYYANINLNYELMKTYFDMAIKRNNCDAMFNMAVYHFNHGNYDEMKKYYYMAIEHNHTLSMKNLAEYFKNIEHDEYNYVYYILVYINYSDEVTDIPDDFINLLYELVTEHKILLSSLNNKIKDKLLEYIVENKKPTTGITDRTCVICFEQLDHVHVFVPCGHTCVCDDCLKKINVCPICKQKINGVIRTYLEN